MKNSLKYLMLWQKKRSELPVSDDQQNDWLEMKDLLDRHLPVADGEKPSRSKRFKLLSVLFVSLSAAAMTYVVSNIVELKKHPQHSSGHQQKHNARFSNGSTSDTVRFDSLNLVNNTIHGKDSLLAIKQSATNQNAETTKPEPVGKSSGVSPGGAGTVNGQDASVRKNNLVATNGKNRNQLAGNYTGNKSMPTLSVVNSPKLNNHHKNNKNSAVHGAGTNRGSGLSSNLNGATNPSTINSKAQAGVMSGTDINGNGMSILPGATPNTGLNPSVNMATGKSSPGTDLVGIQKTISGQSANNKKANKKDKSTKAKTENPKNATPSNLDWGILAGVNSSGSFTAKSQNSNFYGSLPVDLYFGLFATYNLNDNWALNTQIKLFNPQTVTTTYNHNISATESKIDSGKVLNITSSAKFYSFSVPLRIMYKANSNLSFVGGPVLNFPIKQSDTKSTIQPTSIKADSAYYAKVTTMINGTKYDQKLNFGFSAGVVVHFKRLSLEAGWLQNLSGYKVTSDFGSYKSHPGTLQFTVGFQLNKPKP